jgi:hypothetical protein
MEEGDIEVLCNLYARCALSTIPSNAMQKVKITDMEKFDQVRLLKVLIPVTGKQWTGN